MMETESRQGGLETGKGMYKEVVLYSLENLHQSPGCFSQRVLKQARGVVGSRPLNSASNIMYKQAL